MAENALISVIVPVYNTQEYLKRCVDSILGQSYSNIEIILVNDGSTDNSGRICDEFAQNDSRIKVIHKQNGGLSDARNAGIAVAKGKRICFVDSDDMISSRFVEILNNLAEESGSPIVQCGMQRFSKVSDISYEESAKDFKIENGRLVVNQMNTLDIVAWNKLYEIRLFDDIKFPKGRIHEDLATTYKLFDLAGQVCKTENKLYYYYTNQNGITGSKIKNNKLDLLYIYLEQYEYFKNKPQYKNACLAAANNLASSFGILAAYSKSKYQNFCEFQELLYKVYVEMHAILIKMPLRKDLRFLVLVSKKLKLFRWCYKVKKLIKS